MKKYIIDSIYKVKKYLEWVAKVDHNNNIKETFERIEGKEPKSLFEVLNNEHFLKEMLQELGGYREKETIEKYQILDTFEMKAYYL